MTALTGRTPAATYKDLLQVSNSNSGIDTTLRTVSDGEGTDSALQISTTGVKSTGTMVVTGQLTADTLATSTLLAIKSALMPVGTVYQNKTVSTDPATLFGFGTWAAITDVFLVSRGATYTSTGGAATVALSEANLAPHSHTTGYTYGAGGAQSIWSNGSAASSATTGSTGSGTPFSIIPPYRAVYTWERTV